ncbi:MAG TPA: efflux RND transporter periplasmic adaptor subunit [Candidatus Woesebacteria bacterium]|nr:efflux RND transporter periplasmic adaptor subunit [Candidatus Woesebacteria bacterium]
MADIYKGEIKARIVEVRFATSGMVSHVAKRSGDIVSKGNLIASLDKNVLQKELDCELLDYEKVRADFDAYGLKAGEPSDDLGRFSKKQKQASLDLSVRSVELAKAKLDQVELFSPVSGVVVDDSDIVAGLYVSPASSPFKILDTASFYFEFEISQDDLSKFEEEKEMEISLTSVGEKLKGKTKLILPYSNKKAGIFSVVVILEKTEGLMAGMLGEACFIKA